MTAINLVVDAIDLLVAERSSLAVLGRALSPGEKHRLDDLVRAIQLLGDAVEVLREDETEPAGSNSNVQGRYSGIGDDVGIDLRVDRELGVVSGDLWALADLPGRDNRRHGFAASFRTAPGHRAASAAGVMDPIIAEDDLGGTSEGWVQYAPQNEDLLCTVYLRRSLNGIPGGQPMAVLTERRAGAVRRLGLEVDREDGVGAIGAVVDGRVAHTVESLLADAGLEPEVRDSIELIPEKPAGWDTAELHALMVDVAERDVERIRWDLGLLVLGRANERHPGLLGVMFDTTQHLPRQSAAVFASTVRKLRPLDAERKLLQTTIHELGHALNLAHRFEREVGRADSFSHMAYDWRHINGPTAFWEGYQYRFDEDELEFLRHGRRRAVVPGGDPFHSARYWADGDGGYSLYVPEYPLTEVSFRLDVPPATLSPGGPLFEFGQPVFLQVTLKNGMDQPLEVPRQILDLKVGLMEVLIRRHKPGSRPDLRGAEPFVPIAQRCVDVDLGTADVLGPGDALSDNLNLTFGASGFAFAEPGQYDVTALLVVPEIEDGQVMREFIAASPPLRISVAHPTSPEGNLSATELLDPEVGEWFALGGSPALPGVADRLAALAERRGADPARDPVVAAILRTQAFEALRTPVRFDKEHGRFVIGSANPDAAYDYIRKLDASALLHFDAATAASTRAMKGLPEPGATA